MPPQSILKWGNSLAFRIPTALAKQIGLSVGAQVEFHIDGKKLVIEKADESAQFTHRDLLKALRRSKRRVKEGVDFGPPRGAEIL